MKSSRLNWTHLRYDYYISARRLFFDGLFNSGMLLLSYAIEVGFKSLISEYKANDIQKEFKTHKNTHDLVELKKFMDSKNIGANIQVSEDFLRYISLNFNRYPKQIEESKKEWSDDLGSMVLDLSYLNYFDDLIIQINTELVKKNNDIQCDIIAKALLSFDSIEGRIFFHQNVHAKSVLNNTLDYMKVNKKQYEYVKTQISKTDILNYKEFDVFLPIGLLSEQEIINRSKAIDFTLVDKNDGIWCN